MYDREILLKFFYDLRADNPNLAKNCNDIENAVMRFTKRIEDSTTITKNDALIIYNFGSEYPSIKLSFLSDEEFDAILDVFELASDRIERALTEQALTSKKLNGRIIPHGLQADDE